MRQAIVLASCAAYQADFPRQASILADALADVGWYVIRHDSVDGRFPDGELCVDLPEKPAGRTVILCQSVTGDHADPDSAVMSLLGAARCYREHGAGDIVAVVPHLAYARHDRRIPGQLRPVMAALLADLAAAAGITALVTLAGGAQDLLERLFTKAGTRLMFLPVRSLHLEMLRPLATPHTVLIAPDRGAADHVRQLAGVLGLPVLLANKERIAAEEVRLSIDARETAGLRHAVIVDDLIASAATVASVVTGVGARRPKPAVDVVATHLRLTRGGVARLTDLLARRAVNSVHATDSAGRAVAIENVSITAVDRYLAAGLATMLAGDR